MNSKDFNKILRNPKYLKKEQIYEIEDVIQRFPYFQAARVLHLKGLKDQNNSRYNQELRITAAYTNDRSVLFNYITSSDFYDVNLNIEESKIINEIEIIDERVIENINLSDSNSTELIEKENIERVTSSLIEENQTSNEASLETEIESENIINEDTASTFELDTENDIVPEIHDEEIETYIENYSGKLNEAEIRTLLNQYKTKLDNPIQQKDYKESLLFEISSKSEGEQTENTQSETLQTNTNKEDTEKISTHSDTDVEESSSSSNPYGFIFEIDYQESIHTITDNISDTNVKESTTDNSLDLIFEPINENEEINIEKSDEVNTIAKALPIDIEESKPVDFNKDDTHSFNEWMQLSSFKPIDRSSSALKKIHKKKNIELIDTFIENNPKITPVKSSSTRVTSSINQLELTDSQTVMTETLAQIYTEQKKYKNAIKAYEVLSLKFPEKSGFFADQIKMLKELKQD